VILTKLKSRLN